MTYDDDGNPNKIANDDYHSDRRQQQPGQLGKNLMYAEEIDDNLDYGPVDD
jgi:hypothetical protein